jgi:threonine/homoserine/homoserine lactone efflux protein
MHVTDSFFALAGFAFVSSITPGPNNLMLLASGTNFGFLRTVPHMLGVAIGFTLMVALVGTGLVQVFDAFPLTYALLKWASVAYLTYLAWKIATAKPLTEAEAEGASGVASKPFTFIQASLFQWINPKAWTMALTAVTAYLPSGLGGSAVLAVALVFGVINLPSVGAWAYMGGQLRHFLTDERKVRIFNAIAAITLLASLVPTLAESWAR